MEQIVQLSEQIAKRLLHEIKDGCYAGKDRLPPEVDIAKFLGVSRTAIRDGLIRLEREGFITRKHGVGTIINRYVIQAQTRMDMEQEFLEMVQSTGQKAEVAFTEVKYSKAGAHTGARLGIGAEADIIRVDRLITADGVPAIYCEDAVAMDLVSQAGYGAEDLRKPIFFFLRKYCDTDVYMDLTEVKAVAADETIARRLDVPLHSPVLHMDEVGYDFRGNPVLHSMEYYRDSVLHHMVLRKKI